MEIVKKVIMTGTSLCIVIDKVIVDTLGIKRGDLVKVDIKKKEGEVGCPKDLSN